MTDFRYRVTDAAARVADRTGVDPLDVRLALGALRDARLELLPQSVGIGAGLLAGAIAVMCIGFLVAPDRGPGYPATGGFVVVAVLLAAGVAACILIARTARSRRPDRDRYEDAWARLAVEVWPAARYLSTVAPSGSAAGYSRLEFLIAVRDGAELERYARHAVHADAVMGSGLSAPRRGSRLPVFRRCSAGPPARWACGCR